MPNSNKANRKRRHDELSADGVELEIDAPKNKFRPFTEEDQAEEEYLSKVLFGGASSFLKSLEEAAQQETASPWCIDSGVGETDSDGSDAKDQRMPAWLDDEDDGIDVGHALDVQARNLPAGGINTRTNRYSSLLKNKFTSSVGTPSWATLGGKPKGGDDDDSDEEILHNCGFLRKNPVKVNLPPNTLEFKKMRDLNAETYSEGPYVNTVEFHPTSNVALVAGNGGVASLYAVDGRKNTKLHSVAFENFPIICAKFLQDGNEAILGSRQSHIFSYDMQAAKPRRIPLPPGLTQCKKFTVSPDSKYIAVAGKWGECHILTAASKERIGILKQDSEMTALSFNANGTLLYGHSDTGEVTIWDMNMRRVKHRFVDNGCLQGTALALASSNQFLATGSAQGVVNLYGVEDCLQSKCPKPKRMIMNLTTGITGLKFNVSSEILALSSTDIENSVKLLHLGSMNIFSNFPPFGTKLGHVNVLNFSPGSGYVAFGNTKSTVALYRLKHYQHY